MVSLLELKQTMTHLIDAHQQLLNLGLQKRTILVEGKGSELRDLIGKESKFVDLILIFEEQREQKMKDFLGEKDFTQEFLTMDVFISRMTELDVKQWFIEATSQLQGIVQELSQLNRNNQELIQMNLSYIQYSMNIIMPKDPSIGYGKKSAVRSAKLLDAKI